MSNSNNIYYDTCANQTIYPGKFCGTKSESQCEQMNLVITVIPKITSLLSIFGSLLIMYRVIRIPADKRTTYDRLLFGLALIDFFGAIILFLGNWPMYTLSAGEVTNPFCTFQGFFYQLYSATFWYNCALATNYLLRIRFDWSEYDVLRIEKYLHLLGLLYPLVTSFVALGMGIYGSAVAWCWIDVKYSLERWVFFYVPLWIIMIYVTICMILIVMKVKRTEATSLQFQLRDPEQFQFRNTELSSKTRETKIQATLYIFFFLLTWIFPTASRIQSTIVPYEDYCSIFALSFLSSFFVPLQGFFNFLVYIYPRLKKENRERLFCCCVCCNDAKTQHHSIKSAEINSKLENKTMKNEEESPDQNKDKIQDGQIQKQSKIGTDSADISRDNITTIGASSNDRIKTSIVNSITVI